MGGAPGNVTDQPLADTSLAARASPEPALSSVGQGPGAPPPRPGGHGLWTRAVDTGFAGPRWHPHGARDEGAPLLGRPTRGAPVRWPKARRRWHAGLRQIVETVHDRRLPTFGLAPERPQDLAGFGARVAAKVGLHNFCLWLNVHLGRPPLAFADLIDW